MSIPLISNGNDIDAVWLTSALESAGVARGATVVDVERSMVGTGQMGENVRFALTWDAPDDRPATVVGKFPSDDPISRETGVSGGAYEKEVRFYQSVAPTVGIRTPHCFHADVDPANGDFVLLLEDLSPRRQGDQLAGCSVAHAKMAVQELVGLHAPRWNDSSLLGYEWLGQSDGAAASRMADLLTMLVPGFVQRIGPLIDERHVDCAHELLANLDAWLDMPESPLSVVHGDYRLDNMLFDDDVGMATVDWQTVSYGPPANDLAYFTGTTFGGPERRAVEDELVNDYHRALADAGVTWDWDDCWTAYRRAAPVGLRMAIIASQIVVETERGNQMFAVMASRSADMTIDLDTFSLL